MYRHLSIVVGVLILSGCAAPADQKWVSMNQSLEISPKEIPSVTAQANAGDAGAARRLSDYYEYIELKRDLALYWLRKSAVLGDKIAQYNLGSELWHEQKDEASRREAISWLKKSAAQGNMNTVEFLKEIKKQENQALVPTTTSVTPAADAPVAPDAGAAHL